MLYSSESTIVKTAMIEKMPMVIPSRESMALNRFTVTD
jgi:hypothetical protein